MKILLTNSIKPPVWLPGINNSPTVTHAYSKMGTQCLGVQLGHPVSRGHKYRRLVLQVGGWALD
jgi:hypothetical protein